MVYTVTLNPSLDYYVSCKSFALGYTNRTCTERIVPGGKGINVSIVLKNLGMDSTALGFAAGFTGQEIVKRLREMGIDNQFIWIENEWSRINVKLLSHEGTEINGSGPNVTAEKQEKLMDRLDSLEKGDILFLTGNIPSSIGDDFYQKIMKRLEGKEMEVIVDTTGESLRNVLAYRPFLIKPNQMELEDYFHCKITSWKDIVYYAGKMQEEGARNVLVSLAGAGAVLLAEDGCVLQAKAPEGTLVNGVGAGDSMLAGYVYSWQKTHDIYDAFTAAVASGSATAFTEGFAGKAEIEELAKTVYLDKI